jgi:hypothetical protein
MGKAKDLAGARINLELTLDFKPRFGHKGAIFPSTPFFAPSLLLHHFFLSIDIGNALRLTRTLCNDHQ